MINILFEICCDLHLSMCMMKEVEIVEDPWSLPPPVMVGTGVTKDRLGIQLQSAIDGSCAPYTTLGHARLHCNTSPYTCSKQSTDHMYFPDKYRPIIAGPV